MKKIPPVFILILLILLAPSVGADGENPQEMGYLEAEISFESYIGSSGKLDELNHSVYIIPESFSNLKVDVEGDFTYSIGRDPYGNKRLEIFWEDFVPQNYSVSMKVKNRARFDGPQKTAFPPIPSEDLFEYLAESEYVIISDDLREQAAKIVQGSGNGFEAVTRISTWIYSNINYDLSYGGKIMPSDQVYMIRRGTCDEFTNLFLAMCRSSGIPSRYVAGIIYSKEGWGYHAWSEVYLDEWIPVDPTWNEIGWVDATHIEFGKFPDGGEIKIKASYVSEEKEQIQISQPKPYVEIKKSSPVSKVFTTEIETYPESITFGESSVLTIKTTSSADGCLATSLIINPRVDKNKRPIISVWGNEAIAVCPGEQKESHFIITSNTSLPELYTYYNLADIHTFLGEKKTIDLEIDSRKNDYSKLYLILNTQTAEPGERVKFAVESDSPYRVYSNLPIVGEEIIASEEGSYYMIAATETGQIVKKEIEVRNELKFKIKNISKPDIVRCGEKFNLTFTIENREEDYFEIETQQSPELRYVPKQFVRDGQGSIKIILETELAEECSGHAQYLNVVVNDQRIFEKIETERQADFIEELMNLFMSFFNRLSLFLDI